MIAAVTTRRRETPLEPVLAGRLCAPADGGRAVAPAIDLNDSSLIYPLCCLIVAHSVWSLWSWARITHSWFDCYSLFLIAATLFNAGQACLEVFGLNQGDMLDGQFSHATLVRTLFLVLLGLAAMHLGRSSRPFARRKPRSQRAPMKPRRGPACGPWAGSCC